MMLVAPRPLLIISSEWEFQSHDIVPKCIEAARVYAAWRDAAGLPSVVSARRERPGYHRAQAYYEFNYNIKEPRLSADLTKVGAGDCFGWFSFPGGHAYPDVAQKFTAAWYDRWLGLRQPA
jgi:hypothetical protein